MQEAISTSLGRYLEVAYYIRGEGEELRRSRLASWLGISPPSVTEAVNRLLRDGLLRETGSRGLELTPAGDAVAADIVRRHRIVERWLVEGLGLDWVTADNEAQRLGPALSDEVLAAVLESLGHPVTCPHGNPIPGEQHPSPPTIRLAELLPGQRSQVWRISEVTEHDAPEVLQVLFDAGVMPGRVVFVKGKERDGALTVEASGRTSVVPANAAVATWVLAELR